MSKLEIPPELKYLSKLRYEPAMRIDYQHVLLEDILPGLFYVMRLARIRGKGSWNARTAQAVADELSQDQNKFAGFSGEKEKRVLEEWLKASVLRLIERSASDKVMSIRPLHFFTYRIDLPSRWSHLRSIPEFVAAILHRDPASEPLISRPDEPFALQQPHNLFWKTFGEGITNNNPLKTADQDRYDDNIELDIESLLTVRVAEKLNTPLEVTVRGGSKGGRITGFEPLCPLQARLFREDFSLFLRAFSPSIVPIRVLGDYVLCLLALNLTVYSLCHFAASNHLYNTGEWRDDKRPSNGNRVWELSIYPDLTGGSVRKSRELAKQSYARHHEWMLQQLRTMIGFRLLDYYLRNATSINELRDLRDLKGIEFLKKLALGRQLSYPNIFNFVQGSASPALTGLELAQTDKKWPEDIVSIATDQSLPPFDRLVELLASTQEEFQQNMLKYFTSCSRRNLDSGLLAGSPMKREDNYYTLGIKLLETLVQLLILKPNDPPKSHPLDIYEFVKRLKERYGIWIDEPPPGLEQSYESRQAAQANFSALKEKLRQLGFFRSVTDAMRMQRLRPRYAPAGDIETNEGSNKNDFMA